MCAYMYVHTHVRGRIYIYIYIYTHTQTCVGVHTLTHVCIYVCAYIQLLVSHIIKRYIYITSRHFQAALVRGYFYYFQLY